MRFSKSRWMLGLATVVGLTVSTVGCKAGSSFSVPGSSWLSSSKKAPPKTETSPPSISFAPNSSQTPPGAATASASQPSSSLGASSAPGTAGLGYPQTQQSRDSFSSPKSSGYYTGGFNTNAPSGQAGRSAPPAATNNGVQQGFYSQRYDQGQAAAGNRYSAPTANPYAAATPNPYAGNTYPKSSQPFGGTGQASAGQASAGQASAGQYQQGFSGNTATADRRNGASSYGNPPSGSWGGGQQNWQSQPTAESWNDPQKSAPVNYSAPSRGGANGGYVDPYQGAQKAGNTTPADASIDQLTADANHGMTTITPPSSGYRPGSTGRSVATPMTSVPGGVQHAGFDRGMGQSRTATLNSTPGQGASGPNYSAPGNNWQQQPVDNGRSWQQSAPATSPGIPAGAGGTTWR